MIRAVGGVGLGAGMLFALSVGSLSGCGGGEGQADAAVAADGKVCEPEDHRICDSGDAYWADSCSNVGELLETCAEQKPCDVAVGSCCFPPATDGTFSGAPVLARVELGSPGEASELVLALELVSFSVLGQAQAFAFDGTIDGSPFTLAIRADLADNGGAFGPGIAFSGAIGSEDPAATDYGSPVFFTSSPDSGGTVKLSRPTELLPRTTAVLRLVREEASGAADWFALYLTISGGDEESMGRILFPRQGGAAASIGNSSNAITGRVLRDNEFALADVGKVQVAAGIPLFDGQSAVSGQLSYPNVEPSAAPFPNVDVTFEPSTEQMILRQGGVSSKCTEEGELF